MYNSIQLPFLANLKLRDYWRESGFCLGVLLGVVVSLSVGQQPQVVCRYWYCWWKDAWGRGRERGWEKCQIGQLKKCYCLLKQTFYSHKKRKSDAWLLLWAQHVRNKITTKHKKTYRSHFYPWGDRTASSSGGLTIGRSQGGFNTR